jgi:hypothetical protein
MLATRGEESTAMRLVQAETSGEANRALAARTAAAWAADQDPQWGLGEAEDGTARGAVEAIEAATLVRDSEAQEAASTSWYQLVLLVPN